MESKYLKTQLDDIIFESRNKAYGAYALRQSYGKRMKRGIFGGLSVFALMVSSPLIADRISVRKTVLEGQVIEMPPPPLEEPKKPIVPPPPPPPQPPVRQIAMKRFTPPVVTEEVETEPPLPKMEEITLNVGAKTQDGDNTTAFVNVVEAPAPPPIEEVKKPVEAPEKEWVFVEQMPEFKDGMKAMFRFLNDNIKYPAVARENGIEGTVYVGFVIGKNGVIRDVIVKRGISGGCNEEAVRVVSMMPNWRPGRQNGKEVNVAFTLPIKFTLTGQ